MEFLGDDRAIFRVGIFHSLVFHCKTLNMPDIFTERRGIMDVSENQAMENTYSKNSSVIPQKFHIYRSCIKSSISILKYN
jgi:hypothetical protein